MIKRLSDIVLSTLLLSFFLIPFAIIGTIIKLNSRGSIIYWSDRVGKNNKIFRMPKFRSMLIDTPVVATHLLNGNLYSTKVGKFIRKTSLDELPQLWSIFLGDMSFVGPRPALFNQDDLIELRTQHGIHNLKPGLTGWAQINGRDSLNLNQKIQNDLYYLNNIGFFFDLKILLLTFFKIFKLSDITH